MTGMFYQLTKGELGAGRDQGACVAWRTPVARESFPRDLVGLPRHFTRRHSLKLPRKVSLVLLILLFYVLSSMNVCSETVIECSNNPDTCKLLKYPYLIVQQHGGGADSNRSHKLAESARAWED